MSEVAHDQQWIQRCAQRLHVRHCFPHEEACELAREAWQALGEGTSPERAADEVLGAAMPF